MKKSLYQRIREEENVSDEDISVEDEESPSKKNNFREENVDNPLQISSVKSTTESSNCSDSSGYLALKILLKESNFEITGLSSKDTVGRLKELVESATEIPVERQRLILAGKVLRPEDSPLSAFKIIDKSTIHLFPLPPPSASSAIEATPVRAGGAVPAVMASAMPRNAFPGREENFIDRFNHPLHFDPSIQRTSSVVRAWSLLLLFLSSMSLFNNFSYFSSTGNVGHGTLDSFVFLFDTICSAGGIWVALLGLKSSRTLDLTDLRKYVRYLGILGVMCIVMRIFWVFDIIFTVKKIVKQSKENPVSEDPNINDDGNKKAPLNNNTVVDFALQASLIAMICIFAWASCFIRALRLENEVTTSQGRNNNNNNQNANIGNNTDNIV